MPNLPVDTNDIYNQFGVSPKDYFIDHDMNTIKRKELPLPVEILQPLINDFQVSEGSKAGNKLFGTGGEERYQTWPERMVRSGSTIAGDVYSGAVPIVDPDTGHTAQPVIERAQDLAGMAGMSSIPLAPKGALGAAGGNFYSTLENTIAGSKVSKGTPEQWASYLKNQPGVKPEELEFSLAGLPEKMLTKDELSAHVADNGIKLGEVWRGNPQYKDPSTAYMMDFDTTIKNIQSIEDVAKARKFNSNFRETFKNKSDNQIMEMIDDYKANPDMKSAKYRDYQLPGGENYRELLMTVPEKVDPRLTEINNRIEEIHNLPSKKYTTEIADEFDRLTTERRAITGLSKENYKSSHWDEPNVLAHIRMNDREVPGVGKTLHVEEIQSDWHQAGRKSGYINPEAEKALTTRLDKAYTKLEDARTELRNRKEFPDMPEIDRILIPLQEEYRLAQEAVRNAKSGVPNAPFKKTWDELALKRILGEAVNKGYDAVSWTPGEAQAARYDLSKTLREVHYQPETGKLMAWQHGRNEAPINIEKGVTPEKLSDYIGKEGAQKILDQETNGQGYKTLKGQELKVGGEGMKAFYDKMLIDKANALVKKMGGKVEYEKLNKSNDVGYHINEGESHSGNTIYEIRDNNTGKVEKEFSSYNDAEKYIDDKAKGTQIPIIKITPAMRETIAKKGFPLYSSGIPTFSPVDNDPWNSKIKLVPVQGNPFQ